MGKKRPRSTNSDNLPPIKRKKSLKNAVNKVIKENRSKNPPDLASVVLQALEKLKGQDQGSRPRSWVPQSRNGAPKTKKRKTKMSQKSKKTKGASNKKGKGHKYARGTYIHKKN